jgi:SAM-dependent methyltransferase
MAAIACHYCRHIRTHSRRFRMRAPRHALDSAFPRCDWHWRFECSVCRRARAFHGVAYCAQERKFFCLYCAPEHRAPRRSFWGWLYYYRLRCPWRREWHAALDRLEHEGRHPWQTNRTLERTKNGMSRKEEIVAGWSSRVEPLERISEEDSRRGWDALAEWWAAQYSARGDVNREWVIDPALFRLLGDVRGQRILDAGCGAGYLARLLAARGAKLVGVDQSAKLLSLARQEESRSPLGIEYLEGDLARLPALHDGAFDVIVSNVVMQDVLHFQEAFRELRRVLRPGGRLLFSITHPCFERPVPGTWLREPPDSERIEEWKGLLVDRYYDRVAVWWGPAGREPVVGFHRTLEDYATGLREAGFLIARLEEPVPSDDAVRRMYRHFADYRRVPLFLIVEAVRPKT